MATFVLVHGAWHGSWCWKRVRRLLQGQGHEVFTPTLTGVADRSHLISRDIDLGSFIPDVVGMIAKKAGVHGIGIEQQIAAGTPPVHGDPRHLQQVLVNLLNNAIDATIARHGASGGAIRIESGFSQNRHITIKVSDNGTGILAENLKKIFTPFFTTKPVGKGTGLGLSVCYGIIDKMGGSLSVASQENVGTTFTIRLPSSG